MEQKPTTAYILSLLGGIFVLLGGLFWSVLGSMILFVGFGFLLYAFLTFGIVIIVGAVLMNSTPESAKSWGIVILILGVLSLFGGTTTLGGILAIIGGAMALSWKPSSEVKTHPPIPPAFVCDGGRCLLSFYVFL